MNGRIPRRGLPALLAACLLLPSCAPEADTTGEDAMTDEAGGTAATSAASQTPEPEFTLTADQTHARFSSAIEPVLRVPSGAVVEAFTEEASDGQLGPESTTEDVPNVSFDPIHPLTGPVYVEGAEPGDVLAVTLLEIDVGEWGWSGIFPGFGFLPEDFPDAHLKTFRIPEGATHAEFGDGIRVPLAPFPGVMGVAPATDSMLSTIPPRANGGNMDNRHMTVGTTIYFPVFVEGALFSIGDTHAAQGDGEVSGTAIEAPMRIVYRVEVRDDFRTIAEPQYETDDYYAVTAFGTTLDEAARKATRYMVEHMVATTGLTREDAYLLASLAGDLKIAEVVDVPHVLVAMHLPKAVVGGGG
ncbi:MAG TPA: acetamidase/formamidase family protein [Longimicrobiales bacterium]|nr:acetamidase/formamidase family protein [Longimicrobiales bacterium]